MIHFHPSSRSMRFFLYGQGDLLHAALHTAVTPPRRETPPSHSDTKCWRRLTEWQTPTAIGLGRRTLNSLWLLSRTNKKGTHEFFPPLEVTAFSVAFSIYRNGVTRSCDQPPPAVHAHAAPCPPKPRVCFPTHPAGITLRRTVNAARFWRLHR